MGLGPCFIRLLGYFDAQGSNSDNTRRMASARVPKPHDPELYPQQKGPSLRELPISYTQTSQNPVTKGYT